MSEPFARVQLLESHLNFDAATKDASVSASMSKSRLPNVA
jgi:hypothetical protein